MENSNNILDRPASPENPIQDPITIPPLLFEDIKRERERKMFNEMYKGAIIIECVNDKQDESKEEEVVDDEIVGEEEEDKDEKKEVEEATFKIPTVPPMINMEEKRMKRIAEEEKKRKERVAARDKLEDELKKKRERHRDWHQRGFRTADMLIAEELYEYPGVKRVSKKKD